MSSKDQPIFFKKLIKINIVLFLPSVFTPFNNEFIQGGNNSSFIAILGNSYSFLSLATILSFVFFISVFTKFLECQSKACISNSEASLSFPLNSKKEVVVSILFI